MKNIIQLIIVFILLNSCSSDKKNNKKNDNHVFVIILKNYSGTSTNIGSGVSLKDFNRLDYDTNKNNDTLKVDINHYKKIYIKNNNTFQYIICAPNDTLSIDVFKDNTNFKFLNRTRKKYDTIDINKIYKLNIKNELASYYKKNKEYEILDSTSKRFILNKKLIKSDHVNYRKLTIITNDILRKQKQILAILFKKNLISIPNYNYECSKLDFLNFVRLADSYNLTSDSYYLHHIDSIYLKKDFMFNDDFKAYGYINVFIKQIVLNNDVDASKTKFYYNYHKAIGYLSKYLNGKKLQLVWKFCLNEMASQKDESFANLIKDINTYKKAYPKSEFIKLFSKRYLVNIKSKSFNTSHVELADLNYNKLQIKDLINKNTQKLIYIDFWASWCAPCRLEMSSSHQLQKDYRNKNVMFIYISIDKNRQEWKKASKEENLTVQNSFLALNYPTANLYKTLEIKTIPRYLLYNNGKLIHQNAPRPSSQNIRSLLNKYIK